MIRSTLIVAAVGASFMLSAHAAETTEALSKKLMASIPGLTVDSLKETPVKGVYELVSGKDVAYVTSDGRYMFQGILFDIEKRTNLTEDRATDLRAETMKQINDKDTIVFLAHGKTKHTITVFTDPSCPYCRKLHNEVAELNKQGVKVRYVLYPRAGVNSPVGQESLSILCATDRKAEIDKSLSGQPMTTSICDAQKSALEKSIQVGNDMGLAGTPYIVTEKGHAMPGYMPADRLIQALNSTNSI